jgi:hypothetical protein
MRHFALMILAAAFCLAAARIQPASGAEPQVQVTASRLNVRENPGTDARVLGSVARGDVLVRLDERPGWVQVRTAGGIVGWVSADFVAPFTSPEPEAPKDLPKAEKPPAPAKAAKAPSQGGGSTGRKILKYGCLAGAGVAAVLAYNERSAGNDSYDEYKDLARAGSAPAAEVKWDETEDHDGKAQTYMVVSGVLAGAYLLQEFVLERGSKDHASADGSAPLRFGWDFARREARAAVVLARF